MLALERWLRELAQLPLLARLGLLVLGLGGLADVVAHLEASVVEGGHAAHLHEHTPAELAAHLIGFAGMVLVLLGVVVDGVRGTRPGRPT